MWQGKVGCALAVTLLAAPAHADPTKADCVAVFERAQTEREQGHLKAARQDLLVCSSDACPAAMHKECIGRWREVESALPTVVVEVVGPGGRDLTDVRVTCDGALVLDRLEGRAVPMDPGPHACQIEPTGAPARDEQLVVQEGEQHRLWRISFESPRPSAEAPPETARSVPTWVWVLGGIGVAATGVGAAFEISGLVQKGNLDGCRPNCAQSGVDSAKKAFVVGDIALGVGVASLVAAGVGLLLPAASDHDGAAAATRSTPFRVAVGPGGIGFDGSF